MLPKSGVAKIGKKLLPKTGVAKIGKKLLPKTGVAKIGKEMLPKTGVAKIGSLPKRVLQKSRSAVTHRQNTPNSVPARAQRFSSSSVQLQPRTGLDLLVRFSLTTLLHACVIPQLLIRQRALCGFFMCAFAARRFAYNGMILGAVVIYDQIMRFSRSDDNGMVRRRCCCFFSSL
ncbi:hypothetical protein RP20_CCG016062 [Aedes albopictus]|nr:hypothetical protein RP20_CCG016062 [Aedes albopictus]